MNTLVSIVAGVLICVIAALVDHAQFFRSLLLAFVLWLGMSIGAVGQLMIHHLSGGRWGYVVRRILEAFVTPMPAMAILFVPIYFGISAIHSGEGCFNPRWVLVRAVCYFAIWIAFAALLGHWSREQDKDPDPGPTRKLRTLSGPGLCILMLTVSLAVVDWVMVLEPDWTSTMFPGIMLSAMALMALAGSTTVAGIYFRRIAQKRDLPNAPNERSEDVSVPHKFNAIATTNAWHDLGQLLFAFVLFWAYVSFSQLLVIWSGNLPHEATWYLHRTQNGWVWLARLVAILCFAAPEAVLLFQAPKKDPLSLGVIAAGIWLSQAIYIFWAIMPSFYVGISVHWMDLLIPIAVGAIWSGLVFRAFRSAGPIPRHDPRLVELHSAAT